MNNGCARKWDNEAFSISISSLLDVSSLYFKILLQVDDVLEIIKIID